MSIPAAGGALGPWHDDTPLGPGPWSADALDAAARAGACAPATGLASAAARSAASARREPVRAPDLGGAGFDSALAAPGVDLFANRGLFHADIEDHRSPAAIERALADPLAVPPGARPFGRTVVVRPALANIGPSPAALFRLARYTDRVVVAYANATPGQDLTPRPVDEVFGHPVPPALRGKIYASGDPGHRMVPWDRLADLFERQLEALDGSEALGGGALEGAKVTVLGLSAGGVDAAETRRRLEARGRGDVIGRLVNLGTPMRGAPIADEAFFGLVARALGPTSSGIPAAVKGLDPDTLARAFSGRDERLVDLAVTSALEGPGADDAHPVFRGLSKAYRWNPFNRHNGPNDGWVDLRSMTFGRATLRLDRAYDHAALIADPLVIDDLARRMAGLGRG